MFKQIEIQYTNQLINCIKEEIQQNTNIDQPAGQDITLYIMQMEQSHWFISI